MLTGTRTDLRLVGSTNRGADPAMPGNVLYGERALRGRMGRQDQKAVQFDSLVATIQQREAAEERAMLWQRAFFTMAWITGTAVVAIVLEWMKGGA
jgi:hypothetical protein